MSKHVSVDLKLKTAKHNIYPFDYSPINKNSEVLVRISYLTSNYFVKRTI